MTKKIFFWEILSLFTNGERKFIEDHKFDLREEIKDGHNWITNGHKVMIEFSFSIEEKRVWYVCATVPLSGFQRIDFDEDGYDYGEVEYE